MATDGYHPGVIRWYPPGTDDHDIPCQRRCRCRCPGYSDVGVWWHNNDCREDYEDSCASCCTSSSSSCSCSEDDFEYGPSSHSHRRRDNRNRSVVIQYEYEEPQTTTPAPVRRRRERPSCLLGLLFLSHAQRNPDCRVVRAQRRRRQEQRDRERCRGCERREIRRHPRPPILVRWRAYIFGRGRENTQVYCQCCYERRRHGHGAG